MPGTVTSQLTNVTLAEAADSASWDDIGGGPGSAQSADLPIQGSEARARRADNVADRGFSFDSTTTSDLSASGTHVGYWVNVLQPSAATVVSLLLGGESTPTTSPWSEWDAFATAGTPYPAAGGWQRVWIDPTRTRDDGAGTLNLASIRQYGTRYTIADVGGTTPNVQLDRIDYLDGGGGLLVDGGTAPSPATLQDFVDADEGNTSNQYGIVATRDGVIFCLARLTVADATATIFNDSGFALIFADQLLVASDFMGVTFDLQNASTDIDIASGVIRSGGSTNRGDLIVTGTSGAFDADAMTFDGLRVITLTSACTVAASTFAGCGLITAAGANLSGCVVSGSIAATSALLWNVATDTDGLLDDMTFVSAGTGHAVELGSSTPSTIDFVGHAYSGYAGTDGSTGNEVLYNNSGKAITVNILGGGATPTVRNGAGASTTLVASVPVSVTVTDASGTAIENARVYMRKSGGGSEVLNALTNASGVASTTFGDATPQAVEGWVRKGTGSPLYKQFTLGGSISSTGYTATAIMSLDE